MRIGIFVLATGRSAGGPETYEVELIRALARIDRSNEYVIYCTAQSGVDAIGVNAENVAYRVLRPNSRILSVAFTLPALLRKDGIDFFHCTYAPPPWPTRPFVFTVHCLSNFTRPEFYPNAIRWRLNALHRIGLRQARSILCVSEFVQSYLRDVLKVDTGRMTRVYNGVGREFHVAPHEEARESLRQRLGIDYPYLLYVGKLQARKNLIRAIRAYAQYRQEAKSDAKLILAGKRVETAEGIDETIRELGLEREVIRLGYVAPPSADPTSPLPCLYRAARMFVFPSLYEGFGIPVIEAMACGTPVITSNVTSLPEVAGDAAEIVDPNSVEEIAAAMVRIERSASVRETLIRKGLERAKEFTWERCAQATLAAYARMAES
jgi:glycosyltransferase involved in cell wall biosynthesis